ncbi:MAG TPA: inositol monophosphatase family protein, partial [Casimicrobiaceae bacterium]|nr:inositol monophosphatase family protein [Casimicrobiaceae bacterium]
WRNRARLSVELKGPQDFVSRADRDVELLIRTELAARFPSDGFLGEETAAHFTGPLDQCWIVDPIDGTHNFLRGIAYWNVAIAFVVEGSAQCAAVYDPVHDELYHAARGRGAWCDRGSGSTQLRVADTASLGGSLVALGHHDRAPDQRYLEIRARMMASGVAVRNFGAAALQLAHVAEGRLDGFIELQLSVWDAIGGLALIEEAGGYAAPFAPGHPTQKTACLGCAPGVADALVGLTGIGSSIASE